MPPLLRTSVATGLPSSIITARLHLRLMFGSRGTRTSGVLKETEGVLAHGRVPLDAPAAPDGEVSLCLEAAGAARDTSNKGKRDEHKSIRCDTHAAIASTRRLSGISEGTDRKRQKANNDAAALESRSFASPRLRFVETTAGRTKPGGTSGLRRKVRTCVAGGARGPACQERCEAAHCLAPGREARPRLLLPGGSGAPQVAVLRLGVGITVFLPRPSAA